jgi:predicted ATPase
MFRNDLPHRSGGTQLIERFRVDNFKSIAHFDEKIAPFAVFAGPNASGKSNIIDCFRYVRDCLIEGIEEPTIRRYGWKGLKCRKRYRVGKVAFQITGNNEPASDRDDQYLAAKSFDYSFSVKPQNDSVEIHEETLDASISYLDPQDGKNRILKEGFRRTGDKIEIAGDKEFAKIARDRIQSAGLLYSEQLFASAPWLTGSVAIRQYISRWMFYCIDPEQARLPSKVRPLLYLPERGEDLSILLYHLSKDRTKEGVEARNRLVETMQHLVPGFDNYTVSPKEGQVTYRIKERKTDFEFPPELASDGTVRLLALLAAISYRRHSTTLLCIEEPERSLHPWVMQGLVEFMREASRSVQIVVTTHSPHFVRHCKPEELYLVDKKDGVTEVTRAHSIQKIEKYLEELPLDETWLDGYLEKGVPDSGP